MPEKLDNDATELPRLLTTVAAGMLLIAVAYAGCAWISAAGKLPGLGLAKGGLLLLFTGMAVLAHGLLKGALHERRSRSTLGEAEQRIQAVMDSTAEGILTIDEKGIVLSFNLTAEHMFGYSEEDVLGRNVTMLMPERFRTVHDGYVARFNPQQQGRIIGLRREVTGQRKDGQEFPMSLAVNVILGHGPRRFVGVIGDISERRAAEHALRESEERNRAILDSTAEGILTIDEKGTVQSFNRTAERMFGYRGDEVIGRNVTMLMPSRFHSAHDGYVARFNPQTHGRIIGLRREVTGQRRDGEEFPMSLAINVIDGAGPRRFVGIIGDLTEQRRTQRALAEANGLRASILDGAAFAIIATDLNGVVRALNPAAERMLFYKREELVGHAAFTLFHDQQELALHASALSKQLSAMVAPGFDTLCAKARRGITDENEWTMIRKDGSRMPVQLAMSALRDGEGEINGFLGIAYDVTERKRREEYIRHIADHDALTNLPNRSLLQDRLQQSIGRARREQQAVGVMMLDLDHFKRVNDSLGHLVGDQLLLSISERLQECIRTTDTVARMGGDEFAIVLSDVRNARSIERVAQTILESLSKPAQVGTHELQVTPSIGICCYPADGEDVTTLLKNADTAMYQAKAGGRGRYCLFSAEMLREANEKLELEGALRQALTRGELCLHYEPQVDLRSGAVTGMEALLRWKHPSRGMIPPAQFIPIAEETGLIVPIGEWVLRTACFETRQLLDRGDDIMHVSVNISSRQFLQPNLVQQIERILAESGMPAKKLVLEIVESTLMDRSDEAVNTLRKLRELGVSIAVDDFGTGYSSLSYISRFPVDILKIDRSFVQKINTDAADAAVVDAILAMAKALDLCVVAEGIESVEQLDYLRSSDCQSAQGYYFRRAAPIGNFSAQTHQLPPCATTSKQQKALAAAQAAMQNGATHH